MVRVALDAMGGDHAPAEIVKGAILALQDPAVEIVLVGLEEKINVLLKRYGKKKDIMITTTH